jgi:multiple sugar transport system permease protein
MELNKKLASFKGLLFGKTFSDKRARIGYAFVLPAVLYFVLVYFYPLFQSVKMSFFQGGLGEVPRFVGIDSYKFVFTDPIFWLTVKNTLYFVILSVPGTVILALLVSVLLNRIENKKFRDILSATYFLPLVTSLVAAALIWGWIYQPIYGLANYLLAAIGLPPQKWLSSTSQVMPSLAIINIWLRVGFDTIIFLAALQSIPDELLEASKIDGANAFKAFRHITLPLLNPQIVMVSILELITAVKVFDQVYATTVGGPANASRVVMMYLYDMSFQWFKFSEASVVAIFIFISLLLISVLQWVFVRKSAY